MSWPSSRKGVSEIIAALLLVSIALSAGILFAVYASGLMGHILNSESQPYADQLTLDYYRWPCPNGNCNSATPGSLIIIIRNDGASLITLSDFFIQGTRNSTDLTLNPAGCSTLQVNLACTITFPVPSGLTVAQGTAYTVKLVARDGTIFTFSCIYGSYTH